MTRQKINFILWLPLFLTLACGRSPAPASGPPPAWPPALQGARLLAETPAGIALIDPEPHRLTEGGRWPRWAADGESFFFIRGAAVYRQPPRPEAATRIFSGRRVRSLAVPGCGTRLWIAADNRILSLDLASGATTVLLDEVDALELDSDAAGTRMALTARVRGGYEVRAYTAAGDFLGSGRGCSANLSPDGRIMTVNLQGHEEMRLVQLDNPEASTQLSAPEALTADNQSWSADPDWISSIDERRHRVIWAHHVPDNRSFPLTLPGDWDRPALWIPPQP